MLQISGWGVLGFYLWLLEAAVVLVVAAYRGAQRNRPELALAVGPLLVICPLIGLRLGAGAGPDAALICGLGATWLPLLGVLLVPAQGRARPFQAYAGNIWQMAWREPFRGNTDTARGPAGYHSTAGTYPRRSEADDPYAVLGLTRGASLQEIKAAWRSLAAESHPDKMAHLGPEARQAANERMSQINTAYDALCRLLDEPE
jgi:hypothetical protein